MWLRKDRLDQTIISSIASEVANEFGVAKSELFQSTGGHRSSASTGLARHVCQYLVAVSLGYGNTVAHEAFGFDRTSCSYAAKRIEDMRDDAGFDSRIARIEAKFDHHRCAA